MAACGGCKCAKNVVAGWVRKSCLRRPAAKDGHFQEVKTGVLLLPQERVEISPGRRCLVRRFLVSCLGTPMRSSLACMRNCGNWAGLAPTPWWSSWAMAPSGSGIEPPRLSTVVKSSTSGTRWSMPGILLNYATDKGPGKPTAGCIRWPKIYGRAKGKVEEVIARLQRLRPQTPELRESLSALIRYYSAFPRCLIPVAGHAAAAFRFPTPALAAVALHWPDATC